MTTSERILWAITIYAFALTAWANGTLTVDVDRYRRQAISADGDHLRATRALDACRGKRHP